MTKTADGKFRIGEIKKLAELLPGVIVVEGNSHAYVLKYNQAPVGNCALGKSTFTDAHLVPWFKAVTGLNKNQIYNSFRQGRWVN